jgi:hypothetical protein
MIWKEAFMIYILSPRNWRWQRKSALGTACVPSESRTHGCRDPGLESYVQVGLDAWSWPCVWFAGQRACFACLFRCDAGASTASRVAQFPSETDSQKTRELCFIDYQWNNYKSSLQSCRDPRAPLSNFYSSRQISQLYIHNCYLRIEMSIFNILRSVPLLDPSIITLFWISTFNERILRHVNEAWNLKGKITYLIGNMNHGWSLNLSI